MHLQTYPQVAESWAQSDLAAKWEKIRNLRRAVTGAMELARNEKKIGSSLQAHPKIYLSQESQQLLQGLDFAEICIASAVSYTHETAPADAFKLNDVANVGVTIHLAEGKKCERCWQVLPEVGRDHPDLCLRCDDAVKHGRQAAA